MDEREYWQELAARYRVAFGADLRAVAAFGSRARGTARVDSDHDLLLIASGLSSDVFVRSRQIRDPLQGIDAHRVQVLARTPDDFLKDVTPLHLDLALDARVIFEQDRFLSAATSNGLRGADSKKPVCRPHERPAFGGGRLPPRPIGPSPGAVYRLRVAVPGRGIGHTDCAWPRP